MDFASLHELLRSTYDEMMPLCAQMSGIAKGIAGLGALFYIALRVSLAPSFCLGVLHHVLPNGGVGNDECGAFSCGARHRSDGASTRKHAGAVGEKEG